jgi:hypothetical protein
MSLGHVVAYFYSLLEASLWRQPEEALCKLITSYDTQVRENPLATKE